MTRSPGKENILFFFLICVGFFCTYTAGSLELDTTTIEIDMEAIFAQDGPPVQMEIFINNLSRTPLTLPLHNKKRSVYTELMPKDQELAYIRLDPATEQDVTLKIYSLTVRRGDNLYAHFTGKQMSTWSMANVTPPKIDTQGALVLRSISNDPMLYTGMETIPLPTGLLTWLDAFHSSTSWRMITLLYCTAGMMLLLLGGATDVARASQLVILAISGAALWGVVYAILQAGSPPQDTSLAVGLASYAGYPKLADIRSVLALAIFPLVTAFLLWLTKIKTDYAIVAQTTKRPSPWAHRILLGIIIAFLALHFLPDLQEQLNTITHKSYSSQWDSNNVLAWKYFFQAGAQPWVDFWYPYGGYILESLPFPIGEIIAQANHLILWVLLLLCLYTLTRGRISTTLTVFFAFFLLDLIGAFWAPYRYALVIGNIILAYASIDDSQNRLQPGHVLFWLACIHPGFLDPTNLAYAGAAVFLHFVFLAIKGKFFVPGRLRELSRLFAVPALWYAALLALLHAWGLLVGILDFYLHIGSASPYVASTGDIMAWLTFADPSQAFIFWAAALLMGVGLIILSASPDHSPAATAVFCLGVGNAMLMLKHVLRPHMAWQVFPVSVLGLLILALHMHQNGPLLRKRILPLLIGALAAILIIANAPVNEAKFLLRQFGHLGSTLSLTTMSAADRAAVVDRRFGPDKFTENHEYADIRQALNTLPNSYSGSKLLVLGEEQLLFPYCARTPARHVNMYDASPLREQMHIAAIIEAHQVPAVVWTGSRIGVDGLPLAVRNPIILTKVISGYVPASTVGRFTVLRPKHDGEPTDMNFWTKALGSEISLGAIPAYSSMREFPRCIGPRCSEFLRIQLDKAPDTRRQARILITAGLRSYSIAFTTVPKKTEYTVFLDRVWFWNVLQEQNITTDITCPDDMLCEIVKTPVQMHKLY